MVWFDRAAKLWMVHHAVWLTLFPIVTWNSTYAVIKLPFVGTPPKSLYFRGLRQSAFPGTRVDALVKLCTHFGLIYKCICTEQDRSIEICKLLYEVNALWLCELCEERICLTSFALEMLIMMVLAFG